MFCVFKIELDFVVSISNSLYFRKQFHLRNECTTKKKKLFQPKYMRLPHCPGISFLESHNHPFYPVEDARHPFRSSAPRHAGSGNRIMVDRKVSESARHPAGELPEPLGVLVADGIKLHVRVRAPGVRSCYRRTARQVTLSVCLSRS